MSDHHFDAIVVGSGFGGAVAAYRLAEGGQRVCVLERGKVYPPGSFARSPREIARNFWDPSRGYYGLFNLWSFRSIECLVTSGVGGGSLVSANVMMRKDERWFVRDHPFDGGYENWPVGREELEPHYDAVERMLEVQRFPLGSPGYRLAKTEELGGAAERLGLEWILPPLAVTFGIRGEAPRPLEPIPESAYRNLHGAPRRTCDLTGECFLGCNLGSKNTLDHTYLSAAVHAGAELRALSEVRRVAPRPEGGFSVSYVEHSAEREGRPVDTSALPFVTLTADRLLLAAGTLGTVFLLLRNRAALPYLSRALGTHFSGNGDLLAFAIRRAPGGNDPIRRPFDASKGPVTTSAVRMPDEADGGAGPGGYVEDGGFPGFVDWLLDASGRTSTFSALMRWAMRWIRSALMQRPHSEVSVLLGELIGSGELSSGTLPLVGQGRDVPDGVLRLRRGFLDLDWPSGGGEQYFTRMLSLMQSLADALGASLPRNPLWHLNKQTVTMHPLGGCPMGRHEGEGVVDAWLEVFGYPGLFVVDGSVMPGPVGPNPALTIAALADRAAQHILELG